ncbi:MAG TPA: hypothetical protein VK742_12065 [Candidatus Sulfotelmatobacter sp.]|nr:hypothetical protein [Candidatus Sulfotelmatobacter sp.]
MSDDHKKIQEKQLFAQRATAAATAASAIATAAAAASLAQMRRDSKVAAEATLSAIKEQAADEAGDRKYHREVLFFKESDDTTKLDAYCEKAIGWFMAVCSSKSLFATLPKYCQEDGALTKKIKSLLASPSPPPPVLPEDGIELQKKVKTLGIEVNLTAQNLRKYQFGLLQKIGIPFCPLFALAAIGCFVGDPDIHEPTPLFTRALGVLFLLIAIWLSTALILRLRYVLSNAKKKPALERQLAFLKEQKGNLESKLKPILDEANVTAKRVPLKLFIEFIEHWRVVALGSRIDQFFSQGLWIGSDNFAQELKNQIVTLQKDYPTSCRVDIEKLQPNQIASAYETFIENAAVLICKEDIVKRLHEHAWYSALAAGKLNEEVSGSDVGILNNTGAAEKLTKILLVGPSAQCLDLSAMQAIVHLNETHAEKLWDYIAHKHIGKN